jgi:pyridoxamine 5'-phosphate oxidase
MTGLTSAPFDPDDLDAALNRAWALFAQGVATRRGPFHTPTFANVSDDGTPEARTVVLRAVSPETWTLRFHTDRRPQKFASLAARPHVTLHAYDPAAKVQVRLRGTAAPHTSDDVADAAWAASRPISRVCYAQGAAPGSLLETPRLAVVQTGTLEATGRQNFAAVAITVDRLEWLYLLVHGHRRALFTRGADGAVTKQWLAP